MSPLPVADEMSAAIGIRGSARTRESTIRTGDLVVDLETRIVSVHDKPVRLTGKEYSIVELLSLRKGTTVTKEMLVGHLYGGVDEPGLKIIDVFVCHLRKKLAQAMGGKHHIETVWGRGYRMRNPGQVPAAAPSMKGAGDPKDSEIQITMAQDQERNDRRRRSSKARNKRHNDRRITGRMRDRRAATISGDGEQQPISGAGSPDLLRDCVQFP